MTKCIMVQGTMSGVGKSLLTAALCRIFLQDGYRVAPFKSQNMALNSYVTAEGLEMGRAQVVQAQAAGKEADVRMNPILLKPSSDVGSQLIVNGKVRGDYPAKEYFKMKKSLIPDVLRAYQSLAEENDIVVIEGAGSPAEINLKADDIVNMGLAELVNAPVILVGDIDRGGVFAQLFGTVTLLEKAERERIVGTVINKFRGDVGLLTPGLSLLEEKTGVPVLGVLPWSQAKVDEEDSLAPELNQTGIHRPVDIAVIHFPHISNFTDFTPLEQHPALGVRYVSSISQLDKPDLIILPGTKNTIGDLLWLRSSGLEAGIRRLATQNIPVLGICGGYQMLGRTISDPEGAEYRGMIDGMGLLPAETVFQTEKETSRKKGTLCPPFSAFVEGYEIHMGKTDFVEEIQPFCRFEDGTEDGAFSYPVMGTYLHGLFDTAESTEKLAAFLLKGKRRDAEAVKLENHWDFQERQLNLLADEVRKNLNLKVIYAAMDRFAAEGER